jgi:UDP-N-acetylmuramoyl-L-alanyl-D-glutamate--2,6-diaminopimelate ligase
MTEDLRPSATSGLPLASLVPGASGVLTGVSLDSRRIRPGDLYVGLPGAATHGARFAAVAVAAGAIAVLTDAAGGALAADAGVPVAIVEDPRVAMARIAADVYGRPAERTHLFGVTGTNGKTSTVFLLDAALTAVGLRVATIGTIGFRLGGAPLDAPRSTITTPEAPDLQALLERHGGGRGRRGRDGGQQPRAGPAPRRRHGLRRRRVHDAGPRPPRVPPHAGGLLRGEGAAVHRGPLPGRRHQHRRPVGPHPRRPRPQRRRFRPGDHRWVPDADYRVAIPEPRPSGGSRVVLAHPGGEHRLRLRLSMLGDFNVANAVTALGHGRGRAAATSTPAPSGLAAAQVPGRMQRVDLGAGGPARRRRLRPHPPGRRRRPGGAARDGPPSPSSARRETATRASGARWDALPPRARRGGRHRRQPAQRGAGRDPGRGARRRP